MARRISPGITNRSIMVTIGIIIAIVLGYIITAILIIDFLPS